jgi:hypothetical protein
MFTKCIKSWLKSPEMVMLDLSSVHETQCKLLEKAISSQEHIGWHLTMCGYLSRHWRAAGSANQCLDEHNDMDEVWVRKTVLQLWEFACKMWENRKLVLHNMKLEASRLKC